MSNSVRSSETTIETRISYLQARRAIVDDLIRSLELYQELAAEGPKKAKKKGPASQVKLEEPIWAQQLAS